MCLHRRHCLYDLVEILGIPPAEHLSGIPVQLCLVEDLSDRFSRPISTAFGLDALHSGLRVFKM